jgi:hypothetical protein
VCATQMNYIYMSTVMERTKMQHIELIKKIVKDTLAGHFDHVRILRINVKKELDSEGEDLLKIDVIFEGAAKDLDYSKLSGTVRLLRPKLDKIDESAFPLLSFISKTDYESRVSS